MASPAEMEPHATPAAHRPTTTGAAAALIAAGVAAALLLGEAALRLGGFTYRTFPTVQFGWPEPTAIAQQYVPDRELFWVPRDYRQRLTAAAQTGVGVLFMGDSCTEFGTYPQHVQELLAVRHPLLARGVKLGVSGWSTEQGLAQLKRDVLPLHPTVITVYFGWNDHWVALGPPDDAARPSAMWFWLSQHLRLAQLVTKARFAFMTRSLADRPNRVSLERYRHNLQAMVQVAQHNGIHPVLITAPSHHVPGAEPEYLGVRHLRHLSDLIPLHQAYTAATRSVAESEGATLCDAASAFDKLPGPRGEYFMSDGIHLNDTGNLRMAEMVAECIVRAAEDRPREPSPPLQR